MTTLLPILLALGMHPAQTTCHLEGATPVGCVAIAHDPGCTCPVAQVCSGTGDGDGIPHTKEDCEGGGGVWDAVPPANTTACALPHCTPTEPPLFMSNATTLFPAHPKPKRKVEPPIWTFDDLVAMCKKTQTTCMIQTSSGVAWLVDKSPEGVGDSKQPAPVLAKLDALQIKLDALQKGGQGPAVMVLAIVLAIVTLLGIALMMWART